MALTKNSQIDLNGNEMILDADGDTTITADTDDQIDFKTGGSDRVTIDASGNVGIAQTSPSQKLDVTGNVYVAGGNYFTQSTSGYFFGGSGSFTNGVYGVGVNNMVFNVNGGEKMRIDSTGRVTKPSQPHFMGSVKNTNGGASIANVGYENSTYSRGTITGSVVGGAFYLTAPVDGLYQISFNTIVDSVSNARRDANILINDAEVVRSLSETDTSGYKYRGMSITVELDANDTVSFYNQDWYNHTSTSFDMWTTVSMFLVG